MFRELYFPTPIYIVDIEDPIYLNKITKGVYELGSVFKTFVLAAGIESKSISANTLFKNLKNQEKEEHPDRLVA